MTLMGLMQAIRDRLLPAVADQARPRPSSAYMRGENTALFANWRPALREPRSDVALAFQMAAARAVDLIQNSGFLAGAIDQCVADTVGEGLRLNARPEPTAFGLTPEQAGALQRQIETAFALYAGTALDIDAEARKPFAHLQAGAFRQWLALGEIVATAPFFRRPGGAWRSKVRIVPAFRLTSRSDGTGRIVHGVRVDQHGAALGYLFRETALTGSPLERELPARDRFGRPVVIHCFDGMPGQVRGISPLAPALQVARQFDQLANATLTAEILRAVFVASIESEMPTRDALEALQTPQEQARARGEHSLLDPYLDATEGWNAKTNIDLGVGGRLLHFFPGQKLAFHDASKAASNYKEFARLMLHEVARCLGMTVESVTVDWNGTTYTGARIATTQVHAVTAYRRKTIIAPFCQAIYEAWLEEAIEMGRVEWPGGIEAFQANRPAACRAFWRGAPKPVVDDLKTAKAHEIWARLGVMTDEMICAELGVEVEEVYEQRAIEQQLRRQHGLPERTFAGAGNPSDDPLNPRETDDA